MKRLLIICAIFLILLLVWCISTQQTSNIQQADFKFCSIDWGSDLKKVKKNMIFQDNNFEITETGQNQLVKIENMEYLGVNLDSVVLSFDDINGKSKTKGLHSVFLPFTDEDKEILLANLTNLYGEIKSFYLDKNNVENPINPAGWVSSKTIEDVLTEEEKAYYISLLPKDYNQTIIDAMLRSPLVSIRFDEEQHVVEFNGNNAYIVDFIKSEMQK